MHWLSKKNTKIIMIMPAVILFTVFYLAPIFISVYYSFTDFSGIGAAKFIGFKNYQVLLNDKFFFIALKNTIIILIGITITILPLSFIVALLLEKPFRGSGVVQSMIFAPNVIAPILVGLIWLFILDPKMGMINRQPCCRRRGGGGGALVEPAALAALLYAGGYGYDMRKAILERTNGEVDVDVGGLYRSLRRLEDEGAVASRWCDEDVGPRRREYELTQQGVELAEQWLDALRARRRLDDLLVELLEGGLAELKRNDV